MIIEKLLGLGAEVRAIDPHVPPEQLDPRVQLVDFTIDELTSADAIVLITDHDAFDYDAVAEHATFIFDCRHRIVGASNVEHL